MVCAPVRRDNPRALARGLSTVQAQTMLYLTCTTITSVDLARYGISRAKDWVSVDCGTKLLKLLRSFVLVRWTCASAALVELSKTIHVRSLILSSHLFFCLLFLLFPFIVSCRITFAKLEDLQMWPNHFSFHFLTKVRS